MPQLYWIIPLEGGGGQIDNSLPGGPPGHVSNRPPGSWGGEHPGNRPPGSWDGTHPGNRPPGSWGGEYPSGQPLPGGERPGNELPTEPPPGGEEVPEDVYQPAPIPEEIASQYVVSVYNPKTMTWTTKSYAPR